MQRSATTLRCGLDVSSILRSSLVAPALLLIPAATLLLAARRASGALTQPLPASGLILCGLLLAGWAVLARQWLAARQHDAADNRTWVTWLPLAMILLAVLVLWIPGSPLRGILGLIAVVALEEAVDWGLLGRRRFARPRAARSSGTPAAPIELVEPDAGQLETADLVVAEMIRSRAARGGETIEGRARVEFARGQRTAPLHVAFCPPLEGRPLCAAEQSAGPAASVRVAQVLPYGVRFDVKLDEPAPQAVAVEIEFSASSAVETAGRQ